MPRSRNIKPSFFTNDELGDLDPLARLLFAGLWTLSDFKGDLEWREKRIKAQILPYDNCDAKKLAINLDKSGFIRFYSDGDKIYIRIVNFSSHQNPHKNEREKGSPIPCYSENMRQVIDFKGLTINRDKSGLVPESSHSDRADSFNLIPDSFNKEPEANKNTKRFTPPSVEEVKSYCAERNNNINPQSFVDHYESNGWMRGKAKIKDWKACVRTWEQNSQGGALKNISPSKQYQSLSDTARL